MIDVDYPVFFLDFFSIRSDANTMNDVNHDSNVLLLYNVSSSLARIEQLIKPILFC